MGSILSDSINRHDLIGMSNSDPIDNKSDQFIRIKSENKTNSFRSFDEKNKKKNNSNLMGRIEHGPSDRDASDPLIMDQLSPFCKRIRNTLSVESTVHQIHLSTVHVQA